MRFTASSCRWSVFMPTSRPWSCPVRGLRDLLAPEPELVLPLIGGLRLPAATDCELADRALDVEFDPRHLREQIDIAGPDRASTQAHIGRHQVERLEQYADILQDQRIGDRGVLPRDPAKARSDR